MRGGGGTPAARGRAALVPARGPRRAGAGRHGVRLRGHRGRRRAADELALSPDPDATAAWRRAGPCASTGARLGGLPGGLRGGLRRALVQHLQQRGHDTLVELGAGARPAARPGPGRRSWPPGTGGRKSSRRRRRRPARSASPAGSTPRTVRRGSRAPSQRSCSWRISGSTSDRKSTDDRICSPTTVWPSIAVRSDGVSGPRLASTSSCTDTLPMSWKIAAKRSVRSSGSLMPSRTPTACARSTTAREWSAV